MSCCNREGPFSSDPTGRTLAPARHNRLCSASLIEVPMSKKDSCVLHINADNHDTSACLLRNCESVSTQRITGTRHDSFFFRQAVNDCRDVDDIRRANKRKPERASAPGLTCLSPLACAGRTATSRPTSAGGGRRNVVAARTRTHAETALDPIPSRLPPEWSMWSAPESKCRRLLPPGSRRCRSRRSPPRQRPPSHGSRPFSSLLKCFPS